jgi:hypothetical protein
VEKQCYPYDEHYYYHSDCLKSVMDNPRAYGHRAVDIALDIIDCLETKVTQEARFNAEFQESITRLQERDSRLLEMADLPEMQRVEVVDRAVEQHTRLRNTLSVMNRLKSKEQMEEPKKYEPGPSRYDLAKKGPQS